MQWRWGFKVSSFPFIARLLCLLQGEEIEFHSIGGDDIVKRNPRLTQGEKTFKIEIEPSNEIKITLLRLTEMKTYKGSEIS